MTQKHIRYFPDREPGEPEFTFKPNTNEEGNLVIPLTSLLEFEDAHEAVPRNMMHHVLEVQGYELNEGRSLYIKKARA